MNIHPRRTVLALLAAGLAAMPAMSQEGIEEGGGSGIVIEKRDGGYSLADLCNLVSGATDARFLLDDRNPGAKVQVRFAGEEIVPRERALEWLRSVLYFNGLVLVPVRSPEENLWMPIDVNNPLQTARPVYVDEAEIERCRDMVGVFVVATVRTKHLLDTSRARNALSQLVSPRVGRINDVPGARGFVIADYGPMVHSMWKLLKAMDVEGQAPIDPRTGMARADPAPAPAPAPPGESKIAYYEELLAKCETEAAAQYFVARIKELRAAK